MSNTEYEEYVDSHIDEIAEYVDECFEKYKDFIKVKLIRQIRKYLTPIPIHYIIEYDDNPYDHSGIIVENGYISLDQTIMDFLENEYSGTKEPTFISGMGWHYNTYEDELHNYTIEIAADIMFPAIRRDIEKQFNIKLTDEEFENIRSACGEFDEVYDNCIANEFFFCQPAVEFVGIENMQLNTIVNRQKPNTNTKEM